MSTENIVPFLAGSGVPFRCLRGVGVRRLQAEADREFLGAVQRSFALFKTGAMIPEVIGKGRIALDRLLTAGTFFPLECIAELHHISSSHWLPLPRAVVVVRSFLALSRGA